MSLAIRVSLGDRRTLAYQVLAYSSLVALLSGSLSIRDVLVEAAVAEGGAGASVLARGLAGEMGALLDLWSIPIWLLMTAAAYVIAASSVGEFEEASGRLKELGQGRRSLLGLVSLRLMVLALVALVLGVSEGVVVAQVAFRVAVVSIGAPYYVPALQPADIVPVALLAFSALGAGFVVSLSKQVRG